MTAKQNRMYWMRFQAAKKALLASGMDAAEVEDWRNAVTLDAAGRTCGHAALTNRELDAVLRSFARAADRPAKDSPAPLSRLKTRIRRALDRIRPDDRAAYFEAVAIRCGGTGPETEWPTNVWIALCGALERTARSQTSAKSR